MVKNFDALKKLKPRKRFEILANKKEVCEVVKCDMIWGNESSFLLLWDHETEFILAPM